MEFSEKTISCDNCARRNRRHRDSRRLAAELRCWANDLAAQTFVPLYPRRRRFFVASVDAALGGTVDDDRERRRVRLPVSDRRPQAPGALPKLIEAHRAALEKARQSHAGPVVLIGRAWADVWAVTCLRRKPWQGWFASAIRSAAEVIAASCAKSAARSVHADLVRARHARFALSLGGAHRRSWRDAGGQ